MWIPEPYQVHHRVVDLEGYVTVDTNRYSVPSDWIGRQVQVRETQDQMQIESGRDTPVIHSRVAEAKNQRTLIAQHHPRRAAHKKRSGPSREEQTLSQIAPELSEYIKALKNHGRKREILALRQLLRMVREYPREPLVQAIHQASHYGLYGLDRVESLVLRYVASDYFLLEPPPDYDNNQGDD